MSARSAFYRLYWKLRSIIAPQLRSSQFAYKEALEAQLTTQSRWLDLGCGHSLLPAWMPQSMQWADAMVRKSQLTVGVDPDLHSLRKHSILQNRVGGSCERLPFKTQSFNLVAANMVVEHVKEPAQLLREVSRILQPGGVFVFQTPNLWNYQTLISFLLPQRIKNRIAAFLDGRPPDDVFPVHYRMNSAAAITDIARQTGFSIVELKLLNTNAKTVMLGPLVLFELLLLRLLSCERLAGYRTNIIAVLRKVR